jgi:hypothetical protein
MNSVPRKLTLGLVIAFAAAACGDDVTVTPPPPPPEGTVRSVIVSPSSATIPQGGSFQFGAAVDADAGIARTVTWSATGGTGVSVNTDGLASATSTASGTASICAASTVLTTVKGCAQLAVAPPAAPATIDLATVTTDCDPLSQANPAAIFGVCGLDVPVSVNNVYGQITVTANVNRPAGSAASGVALEVVNAANAVEYADTVTLSGQSQFAQDENLAGQSTTNEVRFSFQTGHYTVNATTGAATVRHPNGQKRVRVKLLGTAVSAQAERQYTFNNINGFHVEVTTNLASGNNENGVAIRQISAGGLAWNGGTDLAIRAAAVSYTGQTIAAGAGSTVNFGSGACDLSGTGARGVAAAVATGGVLTGTINYTNQSGAAAGDLDQYEFAPGCTALGEVPFATALTSDNNPFITIVLGGIYGANNTLNTLAGRINTTLAAAPAIRLDNRAPQGTVLVQANPNGRANGWVNDQVTFNALSTGGTSNNMIAAASTAADQGFGGRVFTARVGTSLATALAAPDRTSPTSPDQLAPAATNSTYCLVQFAEDPFRNRTANPGACAATGGGGAGGTLFGVDRAPPQASFSGGLAANARLSGATIGAEFSVALNDTGLVGNSGMNPVLPMIGSVARRNVVADPTCILGTGATCGTQAALAGAPPIMTTAIAALAGTAGASDVDHGYYVFNGTAKDAAGNTTPVGPRVIVYDASAPIVANTSAPATVGAPGYTATSMVSEDVDIQNQWFSVAFAGAPATLTPALVGQAPTVVSAFNPATLTHTNFAISQAINLPLAIQANMAAGLTLQSGVMANSRSQSNLQTTSVAATPTVTPVPTAMSIPVFPTTGGTWATFGTPAVPAGVTGITAGVSAGNAANPTSTTVSITTTGSTATFNNPFTRVDFYAIDQSGTEFRFIGSAAPATLNDDGLTRTFTYSATVTGATIGPVLFGPTPPAAGANYASTVVALGFGASGAVAMISAAGLALNIRN